MMLLPYGPIPRPGDLFDRLARLPMVRIVGGVNGGTCGVRGSISALDCGRACPSFGAGGGIAHRPALARSELGLPGRPALGWYEPPPNLPTDY
jgi:hypothetical protein